MWWRSPPVLRFVAAALLAPLVCVAGVGLVTLFGAGMFFVVVLVMIPAVAIGVALPRFQARDIGAGIGGAAVGSLLLITVPVAVVEGPKAIATGVFVAMLYVWPGLVLVAAPAMLLASVFGGRARGDFTSSESRQPKRP